MSIHNKIGRGNAWYETLQEYVNATKVLIRHDVIPREICMRRRQNTSIYKKIHEKGYVLETYAVKWDGRVDELWRPDITTNSWSKFNESIYGVEKKDPLHPIWKFKNKCVPGNARYILQSPRGCSRLGREFMRPVVTNG